MKLGLVGQPGIGSVFQKDNVKIQIVSIKKGVVTYKFRSGQPHDKKKRQMDLTTFESTLDNGWTHLKP